MRDESLTKQVGKRLKEARVFAGYTQKEVASIMCMTQQQYSRFENGVFELNYEQIVKLCKLYDITPNVIFNFD
ncbi:MAG: helix-turn-helix transcriptional regulator [Clostridia bacterium]|nr:helix-turn-helix transcriptional regulator [Clostridia bacterium]